jgi:hypothetical protein
LSTQIRKLERYRRYTVRPRAWWNQDTDHWLLFTSGLTDEYREGGTLAGRVLPSGAAFAEALHTQRLDGGVVSHWLVGDGVALDGHLSVTSTQLDRIFGVQRIASTQTTVFGEEALSGTAHDHSWVLGVAFNHDGLGVGAVPGVGYSYNVPAVFAQDEFAPAAWVKLAASARVDAQNAYGTFFSPRLSALFRQRNGNWSLRASVGGGYAAPTPFVDEIEATGLGVLLPLRGLHAEGAVTESLDAKWADERWEVKDVPLVPRNSAELGAILENKQRGRIGLELGYTGRQALEEDPYRNVSEPYLELNALGEIRAGAVSIFINAINLTNVRQTRFDPLTRPTPGLGGTPITEVWAPLGGRTFNLGIRLDL